MNCFPLGNINVFTQFQTCSDGSACHFGMSHLRNLPEILLLIAGVNSWSVFSNISRYLDEFELDKLSLILTMKLHLHLLTSQ